MHGKFIHKMIFSIFQGLKNITAMAFDCAICENLKSFFKNKPPMVLFVISLGAFALVLLTLAYIIKVQELPNPDLTKVPNCFRVLGFFLPASSNISCTVLWVDLVMIFFLLSVMMSLAIKNSDCISVVTMINF